MKENAAAEGTPAHGVLNDLFLPDPREDPATTHEPELPTVSAADLPDDEAARNAEEDVLPPVERGESPKAATPAPLAIGWHPPLNGPLVEEAATTSVAENTDMLDENAHKYVGLTNQAMTCYLNSLIQSIYMTPEFRNIIFKIERKRSPRDIQFQLQKLFVQLQTSDKISLPTVDLTNSFGWENEGIYQHDVQELFRLMIEALEKKWANTEHKGCIENLYKGDIVDYVKCLKCKTMKRKNDMFLDLSLAVKSDGAFFPHKSLEESISAFIKPEVLDGNNKYRCDNCDSLEDAEKGLQITEFPYLLAVQLKRFGFDYNTFHRRWIHKDEPYECLLRRLCAEYPGIAVEDARLIRCNSNWAMIEEMPENKDEPPLCTPYRHQNQHTHIRFKLDVYVMIDTKDGADFYPFPTSGQGITTEVHICNLDTELVLAAKRVCVPADAKVGDLKTAFCAIAEVRESDPEHLRFLYDRYRDENHFPDLWEDDEVEIKTHSRYHRENLSIFVDVGSPETLAEDRAIADFKETKFCRAIERKKFGFQAPEYFRVALAPPNSRTGARSPVPSPFVQLQGEMKPILSDNSATSSSAASSCGPPADYDVCPPYDPTEPFEATAALPTNIPEPKSNSLSATSTYSSTPSGTMPTVPEPANTLDADQMEDLIRNSTAPPSSSTPPPPYGLPDEPPAIVPAEQTAHDPLSADVVQKFFPTEVPHDPYVKPLLEPMDFSGMNGYQRLNDEDSDLADLPSALERDGDADSLCCHSNTPKETSPNVSDEEGAEEHFRRNEDMKYNLKGLVSPFSPKDGDDQYERPRTPSLARRIQQKMDAHKLEPQEEYQSIFPQRPPPLAKEEDDVFGNEEASRPAHYEVAVLQTGYEDETKYVRLLLDSRQTVGELQKWMADYLGLKESNVAFEKQYKEDSIPFPVNAATMTTLRECFSDIYKVIVKLQVTAREDENVINIHMYHPQEPNVDKWPVLFRLAIAAECEVSALLSKCQALLLTVYNETYPLEQLRLRKVTSEGCILYRNDETITASRSYYPHETYFLQVIDSLVCSPELLKKPDSRLCSVMARRWCPSKFEVLPMIELFVEESESFGESLRAALSARSGIPPERLAISEFLPESNERDVRFPYTRPVLELLDKKLAFSQEFDKVAAQNGKLVYFKDVEEAEKTATDEERRYIRNKDQREAQLSMTNTYRRVERPLRIQVASESEP
ncbi:Ubiquitin carboxyl-terminal hydrolase [Aphelenchoides fujianensis]|nr:Ubiquitin carboxyl-terminal hydrolase [Aphelenchoides fujianensis]